MLIKEKRQIKHACQNTTSQGQKLFQRSSIRSQGSQQQIANDEFKFHKNSSFYLDFSQSSDRDQKQPDVVIQKATKNLLERKENEKKGKWTPKKDKNNDGNDPEKNKNIKEEKPKNIRKRDLTEDQKNHIFIGDDTKATSKKGNVKITAVTGYHSIKRANDAIAEGFGDKEMKRFGCYVQSVRHKIDNNVTKTSTFFPDNWSENDIIEAIEYASTNNLEVTIPQKGAGLKLWFNQQGYYPNFR